ALFEPELGLAPEERPVRTATILGATRSRLYAQLDDPPIEVKVYLQDLEAQTGLKYRTLESEVAVTRSDGERLCVGDQINLVVQSYDERRDRWAFGVRPPRSSAS